MTIASLAILLIFTTTSWSAASADVLPDKCDKELRELHEKFLVKLRAQNFEIQPTPHNAAGKRLVAWLKNRQIEVIKHEKAHAREAGKWSRAIRYQHYTWWGAKYAISGCHFSKKGIPLRVKLRASMAPDEPSERDREIARDMIRYLEIKHKRGQCKKLKRHLSKVKCLKPYSDFKWLDRYPVDAP